jgi:hypothetical protein
MARNKLHFRFFFLVFFCRATCQGTMLIKLRNNRYTGTWDSGLEFSVANDLKIDLSKV